MNILNNLDLLSVGIAVASILILGFTAYFNNRQSITNRTLLYFCLITSFWSIANYFSYKIYIPEISFQIIRLVIFTAVWHSFFFYTFSIVFPRDKVVISKKYKLVIFPLTVIISFLTLTPLVLQRIVEVSETGQILRIENGPGIVIFGGLILFFVIGSIVNLFKKTKQAIGVKKKQFRDILIGIFFTLSLLTIFNFILPAFFNNLNFIPFGAFFILPFVASSFYAIYKHHLFDIKIISISFITLVLSILAFIEVLFTEDNNIIFFKVLQLAITLVVSAYLIKTVLLQMRQKEEIEQLATNLDHTNKKLSDLNQNLEKRVQEQTIEIRGAYEVEKRARVGLEKLNVAKDEFLLSTQHELRTPLTVIRGYIDVALEKEKDNDTRSDLTKASEAGEKMASVLNQLLEITEIKVGK